MQNTNCAGEIKNRIARAEYGSVFVLSDFSDIAGTDTVRKSITRIEGNGTLTRIARGIYYKPEYSSLLNEPVAPEPDIIAKAIARNYGWTIIPCGDTALNLLGLSTQVPSQLVYISDGVYKEYSFGNTKITFKRTANKEISKLSYKTALIVQALKALGKDNIDEYTILRLKKILTAKEKAEMLAEAKSVTSWIYELIKVICKDETE